MEILDFGKANNGRRSPQLDSSVLLQVKSAWTDPWDFTAESLWLEPESITWCCGPSIPTAQLRHVYGRLKGFYSGADFAKYGNRSKKTFPLPQYVKIDMWGDRAAAGGHLTWIGRIEHDADQQSGLLAIEHRDRRGRLRQIERVATGQQIFTAFGLEQILARHPIRTTRFERGFGIERNDSRVTFNMHGKPNRSMIEHDGTYVFWYDTRTQANVAYWSTRDIVKYLLRWQTPRDVHNARQIKFDISAADAAKLPDWDAPELEQDGETTLGLIQRLVARQRLFNHWWEVQTIEGEETVMLRISTLATQDVPLSVRPDAKIPAAARQLRVIHENDPETSVTVGANEIETVDVVYARGAPALFVGSFSWADSTLVAGWTDEQQKRYEYGNSQAADYDDLPLVEQQKRNAAARSDPRLDDVFSRFTIPAWWDQRVADGLGNVFTDLFRGDAGPIPVYYPTMFIEQGLPFYPGVDYSSDRIASGAAVASEPRDAMERMPVLVVFRKPTADADGRQRWFRGEEMSRLGSIEGIDPDDADRISVTVVVPSHSHSIQMRVSGTSQHAIAKTEFNALDEDDRVPSWDFASGCIVTLALPSGEYVTGRWPAVDPPHVDAIRVKEIDAGGRYERIFVAAQTVVGVNSDGNLVRSFSGFIERPVNVITVLNDLAHLAGAWYTVPHKPVTIDTATILDPQQLWLGDMIVELGDPDVPDNQHRAIVNAAVTQVTLNWPIAESEGDPPPARMTIHTFAGELDPLQVGPAQLPPAGNPFKARRVIKL